MNKAFINTRDWNEKTDVPCPDCEGEGGGEEDAFSHTSGHFTRPVRCDTCAGTGVLCLRLGGVCEYEGEVAKAEVDRLNRELSVAHERIVALTKRLQSGGDVSGAATPAVPAGQRVGTQDDNHVGLGI